MKKEGGQSRSRSRSLEKKSKREEQRRGKKSVASKQSFTSEYLHQAWGGGAGNEDWDRLDNDNNDTWAAKSEIKTENDWGAGHSAKNEDWGNWPDTKTHRTNDQDSQWGM